MEMQAHQSKFLMARDIDFGARVLKVLMVMIMRDLEA